MKLAVIAAAFLAGLLVGIGMTGKAADWLVGSGVAVHLDGKDYCNDITTGLGLETVEENVRSSVGFYRNSNCHWSAYIGRGWTPLHYGPVSLGVLVGAVTGYDMAITPVGALLASIEGKKLGLNVSYIPPLKDSGNVLWFQIKVRW